jgi:hypothetical protein
MTKDQIALVQELQRLTGMPLLKCKRELEKTNFDLQQASFFYTKPCPFCGTMMQDKPRLPTCDMEQNYCTTCKSMISFYPRGGTHVRESDKRSITCQIW